MRLLEIQTSGDFSLTKDLIDDVPPYAILSHTWGKEEDEVTLDDLVRGISSSKTGYRKIEFCGERAKDDSLKFFWVDTCCIDKTSHTELSEAINSMCRWYREAAKCYVYLSDVETCSSDKTDHSKFMWEPAFRKSRWFTRGWTLQELIAPVSVQFFSREGQLLGDKISLEQQIHEITGIPIDALQGRQLSNFSVSERFSWAENRNTRRKEDKAYSLMGIFNIHMPLIYGEGKESALMRLRDEIDKRSKISAQEKKPSSTVPFSRDLDFVGRQDILIALESRFSQRESHRRVVLVGLGGVGKSQIAIEYSYRLRIHDAQTWVFWVHASTAERFEQGYKSIAAILELPGWAEPKADILDLVWRRLSDAKGVRWFLILDNADNVDVFTSTPNLDHRSRPLSSYIPQPVTGSVLITTRDRRVASWLSNGYTSAINVDVMRPENAEQLLSAKIPDGSSSASERVELVRELDYLPLAITQAAAYISARATRMPVSKYLTFYRHNEVNQSRLLDEEFGDLRRDPGVPNSVIQTWQISFEQIKRKWPSAADLLSLMAMLDRQGIPEFLLNASYPDALDFEAALQPLEEFSLISTENGGMSFEMHRLVQLATRKWLEQYQDVERWQEKAIEVVSNAFPIGQYVNWEMCARLWPHAEEVLNPKFVSQACSLAQAHLLYNMASYSLLQGRYVLAEVQSQKSLGISERLLKADDIRILSGLEMLSLISRGLGKYAEAEEMNRRALTGNEKMLGPLHLDMLGSVSNLATVLQSQGKYDEAETMCRRALIGKETTLGVMHPSTLTSVGNLATVLQSQGKYDEAEAMSRRALTGLEKVIGPLHPDTLVSVDNLATVLQSQGKYDEAQAMSRRALTGLEKVIGPLHPDTLVSVDNLATVLQSQGKYDEAQAMSRRALTGLEKVIGPLHPDTLVSVGNLATVLQSQGKYDEAQAMCRRALIGREKVIGPLHPDTLASVLTLATL